MKFMLDTNICIYIIKKKPFQVIQKLQHMNLTDICISSITLSELQYGIEKSEDKIRNKMALAQFIAPLEIISYDEYAASIYGRIRSDLEKKGKPVGAFDLLIAAHALSRNAVLVTNNEKEFNKITGLIIQNWIKE